MIGMRALVFLITVFLACPVWSAEAVNPTRPAPVAVGQIGISIVVPPRDEPTESEKHNEDGEETE